VWGLSCWILTIPAIAYAPRPAPLTIGAMVGVIWRYAAASAMAAVSCVVIAGLLPWQSPLSGAAAAALRIVMTSALFGVLYICAVALLHGEWKPILEVSVLVRDMLPSRKTPAPAAAAVPSA